MAQLPTQSQFGDYGDWPGRDVLDSDGERLGGVREIYLDRETGRPEWVLVDIEGDEARFVPLADSEIAGTTIRVAHTLQTIRSAPGIGTEPRIDQSEERRLYEHYGIGYSTEESASGLPAEEPTAEKPASSWSDAAQTEEQAIVAPPPAEPPAPEEIERAEIPEPPAATERASGPDLETPQPEAEAPAEPEVESPSAAGPSAEPDSQAAPVPVPPAETELISPSATSEPPEVFTAPAPPTPPEAVEPPTPPAAPEPPRAAAPPPEPHGSGGPLEVVKNRRAGVVAGVSIAAVLFLIMRRLR